MAGPNLVGAFRSPLGVGSRLYYYDIDAGRQLETQTSEGDFFFKPDDPRNPESRIGLEALNGARYAPRFPGLLPWEVEDGNFTSSGGVYSVEQGQDIPCFTSEKRPCTFMIRLEPQGEMFVSFAVYK